jgi:regulator of sigma E protease
MFDENSVSNSYLQEKDEIVKVGKVNVHTWSEVVYEITMQGYEAIDITVIRDGKKIVIEDVIFDVVAESGLEVGVVDFIPYALSALDDVTIFDYLYQAFYRSINTVKTVFDSIGMLISGRAGMDAVSGPVGLVGAVDQVVSYGFASLVNFVVLISMNLGIFNLLPIPALDGGHALFATFELITRKRLSDNFLLVVQYFGMYILFGLMILAQLNDILRIFGL